MRIALFPLFVLCALAGCHSSPSRETMMGDDVRDSQEWENESDDGVVDTHELDAPLEDVIPIIDASSEALPVEVDPETIVKGSDEMSILNADEMFPERNEHLSSNADGAAFDASNADEMFPERNEHLSSNIEGAAFDASNNYFENEVTSEEEDVKNVMSFHDEDGGSFVDGVVNEEVHVDLDTDDVDKAPERRSLLHETEMDDDSETAGRSDDSKTKSDDDDRSTDVPPQQSPHRSPSRPPSSPPSSPPQRQLSEAEKTSQLRERLATLETQNLALKEDLEYYVKHESFLYKCIGGQMIEFVCTLVFVLFVMKVCDILLMVTDILEEVVIPIVRSGPVFSLQSKREVGILI